MILNQLALVIALGLVAACGSSSNAPTPPATDPLYSYQWHLKNTGQSGGVAGQDLDVEPAWDACSDSTCHGEGQTVCIVDAGTQIAHEDLAPNVVTGSYNYATGSSDPTPVTVSTDPLTNADMGHGTATAGLAAARDGNAYGGRGVAPRASLIAYDLLENDSSANEADAMTRGLSTCAVSSNSWGFPDGYGELYQSAATWQSAVLAGISSGRGGLGAVYVWAAGNGDTGSDECPNCEDNSNYDGQANFRGVIAAGAVDDDGTKSSYSERGANLWVVGMGGEFCDGQSLHAITSTDLMGSGGINSLFSSAVSAADYSDTNYTNCMNGTSAATPEVAGAIALILQASPTLTNRDVRLILAKSARKTDPSDPGKPAFTGDTRDVPGWATNGAGYHIDHNFGFGAVDAAAAVSLAKTWSSVGGAATQLTYTTAAFNPNAAIPDDNTTGVSDTHTVSGSGISHIEWIEVTFVSNHPYSGDLDITLTNISTGTMSRLAETHTCCSLTGGDTCDITCTPYSGYSGTTQGGWVFGDGRHLDEAADGNWRLDVRDLSLGDNGTFQYWQLKFYGR